MPADQLFVCILVLATVAMFIWEKISPDIVSMCALFLLLVVPFNGHAILIPEDKAARAAIMASVFGNNAILTVAFMFIVGTALERTGLAESFGRWFEKIAGRTEWQAMLALAGVTIGLHFFINNTTVVLVFIPVVLGLCRRTGMTPSRFLIPLSYLAIAGGFKTPFFFFFFSTSLKEGLGGIEGRKLQKDNVLLSLEARCPISKRVLEKEFIPSFPDEVTLRVVKGYQEALFDAKAHEVFFTTPYTYKGEGDRMGYRLSGEKISSRVTGILSEPICFGAIQIPARKRANRPFDRV